jgi:putative membrane-bound dehydrogenase-like protein
MSRVHILLLILSTLFACESRKNERPNPDVYLSLSPEERLLPENATASFVMHEGLDVALFAAEPMVVNPTNIDVDAKGRVWVCESYNYAVPEAEQQERGGRITILEDTDGDGRADTRKVFYQGEDIRIPLGIAVLGNKVYVSHSPYMFVFTDEDGDDKPDKKEKLFTGMGNPGDHSTHAVVFGPDGKLYFNMGNGAGPVMDSLGNILIDKVGNEVRPYGRDYIGGIILRCNPDGSDLEVLGHNFRNTMRLL